MPTKTSPLRIAATKLPPQDLEAEKAVLGCCLLSPSARDDVFAVLRPEHFYSETSGTVFAAIREMHDAGKTAIDALTLADFLERKKKLAEVGGVMFINELMEAVPHAAHAKYYAKLVLTAAQFRAGVEIGSDLCRESYNKSKDPDEILAAAETAIHDAMESITDDEPTTIEETLVEVIAQLGSGKELIRHIGTEWASMEEFTAGIPLGGMVILAARPSMGKSALALSLGLRVAESGIGVLVCSLEMQKLELAQRSLSNVTGIEYYRLEKNRLTDADRHQIIEQSSMLGKWPIFYDDSCRGQTSLMATIRRMVRRKKVKLVILDYLQLVEPEDKRISREQQVAGITRALKRLAMQLNIGILCLSQMNREIEKRPNREPQLSDLRESGAIEQDADQVWFLWRESDAATEGIVKIAKNRNGKPGRATLSWNASTMKFSGAAPSFDFK